MDERYSDNLFDGGFEKWWDALDAKKLAASGGRNDKFYAALKELTTVKWNAGENTYTFKF
jgi:hypothetical protein